MLNIVYMWYVYNMSDDCYYYRAGMQDACVQSCLHTLSTSNTSTTTSTSTLSSSVGSPTWSMQSTDSFSMCMQQHCSATEPTLYNPEVGQ